MITYGFVVGCPNPVLSCVNGVAKIHLAVHHVSEPEAPISPMCKDFKISYTRQHEPLPVTAPEWVWEDQ